MALGCPRCEKAELKAVREKSSGISLGACPKCKGLWFSGGDLARLLHTPPATFQIPPAGLHTHRRCPVCNVRMCAFRFADALFEIDVCEKCQGVWLDEGEYEEIRTRLSR